MTGHLSNGLIEVRYEGDRRFVRGYDPEDGWGEWEEYIFLDPDDAPA